MQINTSNVILGFDEIFNIIQKEISIILSQSVDEIDFENSFLELDINSFRSVQLVEAINAKLGINLGIEVVFDNPGPKELASFISQNHNVIHSDADSLLKDHLGQLDIDARIEYEKCLSPYVTYNQIAEREKNSCEDIAIVGISGRFGNCNNVDELWQVLHEGQCCIKEIQRKGWNEADYFSSDSEMENKSISKWGNSLEEIDKFDAAFFNISPKEAAGMDPQQRLFIEEAYKAFEDSGYSPKELSGKKVGVFVGGRCFDYKERNLTSNGINYHTLLGSDMAILAARISYFLNLKGPSLAIDTACSASLVAIHMACDSIKKGESEIAIAGGVFAISSPEFYVLTSKTGLLSPDGKCKTFDDNANGIVMGEGVGVVVLKPLRKAIDDGDNIYGVIKGSAVNQDGRTKGITAPSTNSQIDLMRELYRKVNINPESISYLETHGTGTKLGDPIEISALKKVFTSFTDKLEFCAIGSIKPNIGHTMMSAGVAGLFKILMAMKYKFIPPTINLVKMNKLIGLENSPFYINTKLIPWLSHDEKPLRAGISSFGLSGTNCHMILEEAPKRPSTKALNKPYHIIAISARSKNALMHKFKDLVRWLEKPENNHSIEDISYNLLMGREHFNVRAALVVSDVSDLQEKIIEILENGSTSDYFISMDRNKEFSQEPVLTEQGQDLILQLQTIESSETERIKNNLLTIASFFVKSLNLEWENLFSHRRNFRISLPTYPFEKESYWYDNSIHTHNSTIAEPKMENESSPTLYFQSTWEKTNLFTSQGTNLQGNVVLFDNNNNLQVELSKNCKAKIILVKPGQNFTVHSDNQVEINYQKQSDYEKLFNYLAINRPTELQIIYNGRTSAEYRNGNLENLHRLLNQSIYPIFYIIKAIAQLSINVNKFIFLNQGKKEVKPFLDSISGYAKSVSLVLPKLYFATVEIEDLNIDNQSVAHIILGELSNLISNGQNEIKYTSGIRYVRNIKELLIGDNKIHKSIKEGGVFLITGGAGALGLIFARHLISNYQAKIVLLGRKPLDSVKENICKELGQLDTNILYIKVDVSNVEDMQNVISKVKDNFGQINGVIHLAGVFDDKTILEKERVDIDGTLKPKINGLLALDEVTKQETLDFFIIFSSLSSILGDFGQCDYSIANKFMDSYANLREDLRKKEQRYGKTITINWPLWKDGGMHLSTEGERQYLNSTGLSYLQTIEGIKAFDWIISSGNQQVVVATGDKTKVSELLKLETNIVTEAFNSNTFKNNVKNNLDNLMFMNGNIKEKLQKDIVTIFYRISGLQPEKIELEANIDSFGFNSLALRELTQKINKFYQINIKPTIFYNYNTISAICNYLLEDFKDALEKFYNYWEQGSAEGLNIIEIDIKNDKECLQVEKNKNSLNNHVEPVAIIGAHGIFPGSKELAEFWNNLVQEKDLITEIPTDRWDWSKYYSEDPTEKHKTNSRWGGFIDGIDKFDPQFFSISPKEAELMDPQHRLFLQTVWMAIEDSGYNPRIFSGHNVGVFAGVQFNDYQELTSNNGYINAQATTGNSHAMLSNRVSYLLDLRGPSESIDTACSSSLVAIHRAVKSIQSGESDLAIAGGASLMLSPNTFLAAGKLGVLSPQGKCRTFDRAADGYVRGEGVAVVLLKPLSKAQEDGDHIYAVIKGSAVNHGGRAQSLTAPNSKAQAEVIIKAFEDADIDVETVTYIEAHGTGTELGDPVEIEGLKSAFNELAKRRNKTIKSNNYCGIGSLKTNIGHLEPAAGIAGLLKVILAMKHKKIPASLNFKELNPYIELNETPFYIINKTRNWERLISDEGKELPRRAGISSFGFGGVNAHIVIEEYMERPKQYSINNQHLIVISAKNRSRLDDYIKEIYKFLKKKVQFTSSEFIDEALLEEYIKKDILRLTSDVIQCSEKDIELDIDFIEYGFEHITLVKLIDKISEFFNINFHYSVFECPSLRSVIHYLIDNFNVNIRSFYKANLVIESDCSKNNSFITDLAYTLQVGREAMEERFATVVNDITELLLTLEQYLSGKTAQINAFWGNSKKMSLTEIDGIGQSIDSLYKDKQLSKLAKLWVSGADIDWSRLYLSEKPNRISLPTYQFEQKRFWFDSFSKKGKYQLDKQSSNQSSIQQEKILTGMTQESTKKLNSNSINIIDLKATENNIENSNETIDLIGETTNKVILKIIDNIALVKIQDEENKNMFSQEVIKGLINKFMKINNNHGIKAVVLTGYDNVFCMGGTQKELLDIANQDLSIRDLPFLYKGLLECEVPVITAIQGHAVGGGLIFGLFGDIVVMSEDSIYSTNFMKYGFTPGLGATFILKEKLGYNLATEMMFTAESFKGEELKTRGVSVIFKKQEDVLKEAFRIAKVLSEKPLYALKVLKKELSARILDQLPLIIEREVSMHEQTFTNPEVKKRIDYYFNKIFNGEHQTEAISVNHIKSKSKGATETKLVLKSNKKSQAVTKNEEDKTNNGETMTVRLDIKELAALKEQVIDILVNILHIKNKELNVDFSFKELGVDSIIGVELIREINKHFNTSFESVVIYDFSTVNKLTEYIYKEIRQSDEAFLRIEKAGDILADNQRRDSDRSCVEGYDTKIRLKIKDSNKNREVTGQYIKKHNLKGYKNLDSNLNNNFDSNIDTNLDSVISMVIAILEKILHVDSRDVATNASFKDLGVDSIIGVELIREINKKFNLSLEAVSIYDYSTIQKLSQLISMKVKNNIEDYKVLDCLGYSGTDDILEKDQSQLILNLLNRLKTEELEVDEVDKYLGEML